MIDMKVCSRCKQSKDYSEFHKHSRGKDGYKPACKVCRNKDYKESDSYKEMLVKLKEKYSEAVEKTGGYAVYYLPEHHYVGMTNNIDNRMMLHRSHNKRITDGYEIIGVYSTAIEAHLVETTLHLMGYYGFSNNYVKYG
jgi:hypothetical protein